MNTMAFYNIETKGL